MRPPGCEPLNLAADCAPSHRSYFLIVTLETKICWNARQKLACGRRKKGAGARREPRPPCFHVTFRRVALEKRAIIVWTWNRCRRCLNSPGKRRCENSGLRLIGTYSRPSQNSRLRCLSSRCPRRRQLRWFAIPCRRSLSRCRWWRQMGRKRSSSFPG